MKTRVTELLGIEHPIIQTRDLVWRNIIWQLPCPRRADWA